MIEGNIYSSELFLELSFYFREPLIVNKNNIINNKYNKIILIDKIYLQLSLTSFHILRVLHNSYINKKKFSISIFQELRRLK